MRKKLNILTGSPMIAISMRECAAPNPKSLGICETALMKRKDFPMLPSLPPNSYPLRPTGYVQYSCACRNSERLTPSGRAPVWDLFHDGAGSRRIAQVLLIRITPSIEVVLVSAFRDSVTSVDDAIRKRLTKPKWTER